MKAGLIVGGILAWFGLSASETLALQVAIGAIVLSVGMSIYVLWKLDGVSRAAQAAEGKADALVERTDALEAKLRGTG